MAKQSTNSAALVRLQPLQNVNYGAIVEEHLRYWKDVKDADEAKELARRQAAEDTLAKARKERAAKIPDIAPEDKVGVYQFGYVQAFKDAEDDIAWNRQMYINTEDPKYLNKLKEYERQFKAGSTLVGTHEEKQKELYSPKGMENFNPHLDQEKRAFFDHITNVELAQKDGKIWVPSFEDPDVLEPYSYEEMAAKISNMQWSGNPDLGTIGTTIASRVKPFDNNGNKRVTAEKEREGIIHWKNHILNNDLERATLAKKYDIEPEEEGKLSPKQIDEIAIKAFNEYSRSSIQESARERTTTTTDPSTRNRPIFRISTDQDEKPISNIAELGLDFISGTKVYATGVPIKTPENNIIKYAVLRPNGKLSFAGFKEERDQQGTLLGMTTSITQTPIELDSDADVDFISKSTFNPATGENFRNQAELRRYLERSTQSTTEDSFDPTNF
jgi:hypothetical protein